MDMMIQKELEKWEACLADFDTEMSDAERALGIQIKHEFEKVIPKKSTLIEAGCGSGHLSIMLAEDAFYKVSVLDFSEKVVDVCVGNFKKHNMNLEDHYVGNLFDLPSVVNKKYDVVWNSGVLEHYDDNQIVDALHKMKQVSNRFVVTLVPNSSCFLYQLWREHISSLGEWKWGQEYAKSTMVPYFESAGIKVLKETYCGQDFAKNFTYSMPGVDMGFRQLIERHLEAEGLSKSAGYLLLTIGEIDDNYANSDTSSNLLTDGGVSDFSYLDMSKDFKLTLMDIQSTCESLKANIRRMESYIKDKEDYIAALLTEIKCRRSIKSIMRRPYHFVSSRAKRSVKRMLKIKDNAGSDPYGRINYFKDLPVLAFIDASPGLTQRKCSLIATCLNEGENAVRWLQSVEKQTVLPDEIIIVDGGSQDNTAKLIEKFASLHPELNLKLIVHEDKLNISQGRNTAVAEATNDLVIASDFGTVLKENFIECLVYPFDRDSTIDLAFCKYGIQQSNGTQRIFSRYFIPDWRTLDVRNFIPSSRAIAFKKSLWSRIDGYPEWLTKAGEDTLFALQYRKYSKKWAYCSGTTVDWIFPKTPKAVAQMAYNYGKGDGESGLIGLWGRYVKLRNFVNSSGYRDWYSAAFFVLTNLRLGKTLAERFVNYYAIKGTAEGYTNRIDILVKKRKVSGNVLILAGVPFYDAGGGQRGTQMSLEFIAKGMKVTFANIYPSYEESKRVYFDTDYTMLDLISFSDFKVEEYVQTHRQLLDETIVILEFPHPLFVKAVDAIKRAAPGVTVIYDCIDKWDSSLGGDWYSDSVEMQIVDAADFVVASAIDLKDTLESKTNKHVLYLPQGVNSRLFNLNTEFERPFDLPKAEKLVMYVGSLWGSWFDWKLLEHICSSFPNSAIICIGGYNGESPFQKSNLYFLGLKEQNELPNYLYFADACIIPFVQNELTQAVNPLKVYEYLAMGKPVVSTSLKELSSLPNVYVSETDDEFLKNLAFVLEARKGSNEVEQFVAKHSWTTRIDELLLTVRKIGDMVE